MRNMIWVPLVLLAACSVSAVRAEAADDASAGDRAKIEASVKSYAAAFNARDAKALAAHWSPEGVYISRLTGAQTIGREALEKEFTALFAEVKDAKLEVATTSIEFVSPNVALEQGSAVVVRPKAKPDKSTYSAVYVKREGKWLLDRISEEGEQEPPPSHYEQLKDLEWMIGNWEDKDGGDVIKTQCQWTRNKNYIMRAFTASVEDRVNLTGMQFVGWDAARKQIRSWVFDSDGGFSEGVWTKKDNQWLVQTKATLPNGKLASSTSILKPIDGSRFAWQKVNRVVDGEILPNIDEVVIVRE